MVRKLGIVVLVLAALTATAALALWWFNPRLSALVEGDGFRNELDKETAKGLHFASGEYAAIQRTGLFSATCPHFQGSEGEKALTNMEADNIRATFNPLGIFLRRWQLDSVHIDSGRIEVQKYEPKPENKPPKPWYAIFLPDRVYLREVVCDKADVTWEINGQRSGFLGTRLKITPHGRDFEYRARGGIFRMRPAPDLENAGLHMLITKERLSLYSLDLAPSKDGLIRVKGQAGLKEDKTTKAEAHFKAVPIRPWLPAAWGKGVSGLASGWVSYEGPDQKPEHSSGKGELEINDARLVGIPLLDYIASAARNEELKELDFRECSLSYSWKYPRVQLTDIRIEAQGDFRIEGGITVDGDALSGTLDFGVSEKSIAWLPKARQEIFTKLHGGYVWTRVKLSGTLTQPKNDLVPRMEDALKRSPGVSAGLFLRQVGEWIQQKTGGD